MASRALDNLYGALSQTERARLVGRCLRNDDFDTLRQIRYTVPQGSGAAFNHLMDIARRHRTYVPLIASILQHTTERDSARLNLACYAMGTKQLHMLATWDVWRLVGYPVTEREYAGILALDAGRPESLQSFARHLYETYEADAAEQAGWRPEVVNWLRASEAETDEEWSSEALALLQAAIGRGELPAPVTTAEGPSVPWGVCRSWLQPGRTEFEPLGPDYHVPLMEALSGYGAKWERHPDSEQEAVTARRELLAQTLAGIACLPHDRLPGSIHPPVTLAEQDAESERVQAAWPWGDDEWRERLEDIGRQSAAHMAEREAILDVLEESRIEDFGGEDPIDETVRGHLEALDAAMLKLAECWHDAGEALRMDEWPALAADGDILTRTTEAARHTLRALDDDD